MTAALALGLTAMAAAYLAGVERVWRSAGRGRLITGRQVACGMAGFAVVAGAALTPLDEAAHAWLTAHMVQHLLLLLPAALLLAAGRLGTALLWLAPGRHRLRGPAAGWRRRLRAPGWLAVGWGGHVLVMLGWHVPRFYDAALQVPALHGLEHLTITGTAVALWWTVLRNRAYGAGAVLAAATAAAGAALGVLLVFSPRVWYVTYEAAAVGRAMSAGQDQQLGGAVMWVVGGAGYVAISVALIARWLHRSERRSGGGAAGVITLPPRATSAPGPRPTR